MNLLVLWVFITASAVVASAQFNREFMGVAFSPYLDTVPNARNWDKYSLDDIKVMLRVVKQYFSMVSSYGMGVADYNRGKSWDQCDSNALVARAAAQINREGGQKLTVNIGVYQINDRGDQQREIDNAFSAASDANSISGGTVTGITFTNEFITDSGSVNKVLGMIRGNSKRGQRVGTRTERCNLITEGGEVGDRFRDIVRSSDFIYCNVYASQQHAQLGPERAAQEVMWYFLGLKNSIKNVNSNIEVMIGETGWPSLGKSFNNSPNSDANLAKYWETFNRLAVEQRIKVQMFEAFNEPWKGNNGGGNTAEAHYGWWYKPNSNENRFIEKKTGRVF